MKRLYSVVICACTLLLIGTCVPAYAGETPGSTCRSAIPMTKEPDEAFTYTVKEASPTKPHEVWFSAMTFDLPLSVYFAPDDGMNTPAPEVEMDFSCISGYYENEILCSLFCKTGGNSGLDVKMPYQATLSSKKLDDGTFVYYMQLGERYRNLLLQMGISENLKVVVHVIFKSTGVLKLAPDDFFTNCMDDVQFMQLGDTAHVKAKDKDTHVTVPYVQWQEDTIVYSWTGTKPCQLAVAATCEFDPTDQTQEVLVQFNQIQPGQSLKVKAEDIYKWVHNKDFPPQAGMYFAKFYSEAEGDMRITKAPQAQPEGGAILMRFGTTYALDANSQAIYAIPRSWNVDIICSTPTVHLFSMEISKSAFFNEEDVLASYSYNLDKNGRWLGLVDEEMTTLWKKVPNGQPYLYIRFKCTEATSITADRWAISECYKKTKDNTVAPNQDITVQKKSTTTYRFSYAQWRGGDMTIQFSLSSNCLVYFADTCGFNTSDPNADYWLIYKETIDGTTPYVIPAEKINSWAEKMNEEGCFYGLFYSTANGTRKLTFTTNAPEETDPVYPTATIAVSCDGTMKPFVQVSKTQTIIIRDETGSIVKTITDAQPETKYSLSEMPAGKYTLEGESEKIIVKL